MTLQDSRGDCGINIAHFPRKPHPSLDCTNCNSFVAFGTTNGFQAVTRGGRRPLVPRWYGQHVYGYGRRGRRRVRVTECWSVLRAEDVYTELLRDDASRVAPGVKGTAILGIQDREFTASWEVRQNAVWRAERVLLRCPRCLLRCTRLYVPLPDSRIACRQCWGLTYPSRRTTRIRFGDLGSLRNGLASRSAIVPFRELTTTE